MYKIALVNSSHQKKNYTGLVLNVVRIELESKNCDIIDVNLKDFNLPFPGDKIENDNTDKMKELLSEADAYIIGSPEYNGSFTAKLKLMVENSGFPSVMKGKPLGLVGLASGVLGATKSLEQERVMFSHIGCFVLPRVVSIANIESKFDDSGKCIDEKTEKDIRLAAKNMIEFLDLINNH